MIVEELSFQLNYSKTPFNMRFLHNFIPKKIKEDKIISTVINSICTEKDMDMDQVLIYHLSHLSHKPNLVLLKKFEQTSIHCDLNNLIPILSKINSRTLFISFGKAESIEPLLSSDINTMYASLCPQTLDHFYSRLESSKKNMSFSSKEEKIIYQEDFGKTGILSSSFDKKIKKTMNHIETDAILEGWGLFSCVFGAENTTEEKIHIKTFQFDCSKSAQSIICLRRDIKKIYQKICEDTLASENNLSLKIIAPSHSLASLILEELKIREPNLEKIVPDFLYGWCPKHTFLEAAFTDTFSGENTPQLIIDFSKFPLGSAYRIHKDIKEFKSEH